MEPRDPSPEGRSSDSESASASSSGSERDAGPEPDKAPRRLTKRRFPGLRLFGHRAPGHCFPCPAACVEPPPTCSLLMWSVAIPFGACMVTIDASASGGPQASTLVLGAEAQEPRALQHAP